MVDPTAGRWQRMEAVFAAALALPEGARGAYFNETCGADAGLRAEIETLLIAAEARTGSVVVDRALGFDSVAQAPLRELAAGTQLGNWRVQSLIGRGGMGEVYACERTGGDFDQRGALKLMRAEADEHLLRFHTERQVLANLEHPGIARLLDGGTADDGRPYMVLEFVAGLPIAEYCRKFQPDLSTRLELFHQVCAAVAYAHANLIVHRDLKSSNVLVTESGQVKLLDFGIAKLLGPEFSGDMTQAGPLTPECAAPEQLAGRPITTATDVYALGVLLHELLTGTPLWNLRTTPIAAAMHRLLNEAPPLPSQVALNNPSPPIPAKMLQGDLDAIVAHCLRKEPGERYPTTTALSQDIACFQRGEPVSVGPDNALYRFGKLARRHRVVFAAVAAMLVALIAGLGISIGFYVRAEAARAQAVHAQRQADAASKKAQASAQTTEAVNRFLTQDLLLRGGVESQIPAKDATLRNVLDQAAARVDERFKDQPAAAAAVHEAIAHAIGSQGAWQQVLPHFEKALLLHRSMAGDDSLGALRTKMDMSETLLHLDRRAEALPLLRNAVRALERTVGPQDALTLRARTLLADQSFGAGDFQLAADQQQKVLNAMEASRRPAFAIDEARRTLGYFLYQLSDLEAAEQTLQAALRGNNVAPSVITTSIHRGVTRFLLGAIHMERGQLDVADEALVAGVNLLREVLNSDHAWVNSAEIYLGRLRVEQGRDAEALRLLRHAIQGRESRGGKGASAAIRARHFLAEAHQRAGRLMEARKEIETALAAHEKADGSSHPFTLKMRAQLAEILYAQGHYDRARETLAAASAEALRNLPLRHLILARWRRIEGLLARQAANEAAAREALAEAFEIYALRLGKEHGQTKRVQAELSGGAS